MVKLAAGLISGSNAMLAEVAHSAAVSVDQVFLGASLGQREPDEEHQFGHQRGSLGDQREAEDSVVQHEVALQTARAASDEIDTELRRVVPQVAEVFLDATPDGARRGERDARRALG